MPTVGQKHRFRTAPVKRWLRPHGQARCPEGGPFRQRRPPAGTPALSWWQRHRPGTEPPPLAWVVVVLGLVVAHEMGYGAIPVLIVPRADQAVFDGAARATISENGRVSLA